MFALFSDPPLASLAAAAWLLDPTSAVTTAAADPQGVLLKMNGKVCEARRSLLTETVVPFQLQCYLLAKAISD